MKYTSIIAITVITLILMAGAGSAHTNGAGTMTVSPTSVTAGSTGNNFIFTFDNKAHALIQATLTVPSSWTKPQRTNSGGNGYVSVTANGATGITYTISDRTITVNFKPTSAKNKGFIINYKKVDAPTTSGSYTFTTKTKISGGALTDIETQPHVGVKPASASNFVVSGFKSPITAGDFSTLVVKAQDKYGNTATGYTGKVHITSSDGKAVLPQDTRFVATDNGIHSFNAALKTAGTQWIKATDVDKSSIKGSQTDIVVQSPTYTHGISPSPKVGSTVTAFISSTSTTGTKMQFIWKRPNGFTARTHYDSTRSPAPPNWEDSINPNIDGTWKSIGNEFDSMSVKLGTSEKDFVVTENPEFGKLGAVLPLFAVGFIYMNYRKKLNK